MEIKIDSERNSQLKRIRKSLLLLIQEESLAKKFKKYPCQFEKCQKTYKETIFKIFLIQNFCSPFMF